MTGGSAAPACNASRFVQATPYMPEVGIMRFATALPTPRDLV